MNYVQIIEMIDNSWDGEITLQFKYLPPLSTEPLSSVSSFRSSVVSTFVRKK
jgi:hypothetical protein